MEHHQNLWSLLIAGYLWTIPTTRCTFTILTTWNYSFELSLFQQDKFGQSLLQDIYWLLIILTTTLIKLPKFSPNQIKLLLRNIKTCTTNSFWWITRSKPNWGSWNYSHRPNLTDLLSSFHWVCFSAWFLNINPFWGLVW